MWQCKTETTVVVPDKTVGIGYMWAHMFQT